MPPLSVAALDLIPRDSRGIVRKYARQFPANGESIPSLEFAPSQMYKGLPLHAQINGEKDNERLLDFRYRVPSISSQDVRQKSELPGWPHGLLNGEVVVLGGTFKAARDRHSTPVRLMDGSEIVAQGIEAEIENTGIPLANPWFAGLLQFLAGFGLIVLYRYAGLRVALLSSLVLLPLLSIGASLILFHRIALWAALIPVLVSLLITELYTKASLYFSLCQKFSDLHAKVSEPRADADKKSQAAGAA